jgi:transglutaminase-like putative cysteine protease
MKARAFYDFITKNMYYTFMPEYITQEDLAENCARNYTGDCGIFALLFLTLCRCAGIPAQWQSGLAVEPDFIGGHDWVRFYVEPYGWIFTDGSYGISSMRAGNEERRQFYFGNLDPYRMVANRAFQENFTIPKQQWRADPYDNQLGEIESADRGFNFDDYERTKTVLLCEEV